MLHVIERIVNFLAADADVGTPEGKVSVGTAEYALNDLLEKMSTSPEETVQFKRNTIYKITKTKDDYTIEFSKSGNPTSFTINLTALPDKTKPQQYGCRGPSQSFEIIRTESDLVSFMERTQ
jgi:hypothetical protein